MEFLTNGFNVAFQFLTYEIDVGLPFTVSVWGLVVFVLLFDGAVSFFANLLGGE